MSRYFVGRKLFWILVAGFIAFKVCLVVAMEYAPQAFSVLRSVDTGIAIGLAIAVGARFADIGWSRWLGITLVALIMVVLPVVLIFVSPSTQAGPDPSPLDAVPDLAWISTVALIVLLVVAGSKRSAIRDSAIADVFEP
jgi:hypothetical protein